MGILNTISRLRGRDRLIVSNNRSFARFDYRKQLTDYTYVVFDTELTGLNRKKDEIIAIGAVRIRDLQIDLGETFHYYVKPQNRDHL